MTHEPTVTDSRYDRRTVLKAGVAAATTAAVGAGTPGSATASGAASTADASLKSWLENVDNFDGIVDERGASEVTVTVGSQGNNGAFGFGPAVVRVDPGTTVVWEWTGKGGSHNVVEKDGSYESKMQGETGATFEQAFEAAGVSPYYCDPHKTMGMKGAVVVGDAEVEVPATGSDGESGGGDESASDADVDYDGWFDNVGNFDGTVDATGEDEVTIEVGVESDNGPYGFGPAAVNVDPGTTVVWEWTGKGGSHNVVATDGSYESDLVGDSGATFERTFEDETVSKYYCGPHKAMGMKGAVVVGDPEAAAGGEENGDAGGSDLWLLGLAGGFVSLLLSPLLFSTVLSGNEHVDEDPQRPNHS
jgi:halocyanin-like protein